MINETDCENISTTFLILLSTHEGHCLVSGEEWALNTGKLP